MPAEGPALRLAYGRDAHVMDGLRGPALVAVTAIAAALGTAVCGDVAAQERIDRWAASGRTPSREPRLRFALAEPEGPRAEGLRREDGLVPDPVEEWTADDGADGDAPPRGDVPIACDGTEGGDLPWWDRPTLLDERFHGTGGFTAEYIYTGEVFNNARGGLDTNDATRYRGLFDLVLRMDTATAGLWEGGEVFAYMQSSHGETLTRDFVGDSQLYSNIDTSPRPQDLTQLGELWYRQTFADAGLSVKVGRQDANSDFGYADLGGDFVNASFTTVGNVPMPYWPTQTLGLSAFYDVADWVTLSGGVYDSGRDVYQWWVTTAERGAFSIAQAELRPNDLIGSPLPTTIRVAGWHLSNDLYDVDGASVVDDGYGLYTTADQMLYLEEDGTQGLGVFGYYGRSPSDRNWVPVSWGTGLVYRGLLPGRDEDVVGVGYSRIEFSPRLSASAGMSYEDATELFYKARLTRWASLQPDVQYIGNPSGTGRDAVVVGLRYEIVL